nr:retrovirus-related Pol polyprotein from transposon TNT 1-94 [Tanacetum cinerariifolium]
MIYKGGCLGHNRVFSVDNMQEEDKVKIVSIHVYDRALAWNLHFMRNNGYNMSWAVYEEAILKIFGGLDDDPMVLNTEAQSISMYMDGLPPAIEMTVRVVKPKSLVDAFSLSNLQEVTQNLIKQKYAPILPTPKPATTSYYNKSTHAHVKNTTTTLALPAPNIQQVTNGQIFTLEVLGNMDEGTEVEEEEECVECEELRPNCNEVNHQYASHISLNAFFGVSTFNMMRIGGMGLKQLFQEGSMEDSDISLEGLLQEYGDVFQVPILLTPCRSFDHTIPLKDPSTTYVKDNEVPVVHGDVSSVPTDAFMMIYDDLCEPRDQYVSYPSRTSVLKTSLTVELATYKEHVELYEQRAKFELTEREQKINEQLSRVISDRNFKEETLKGELHSIKLQLASTINHNKSIVEEVSFLKKDFKQKENKYLEDFLDMKSLKEKVEDKLIKQDQSLQTVHMLCRPRPNFNELNMVAIGYKNPLCLTRAKQV